MKKEVFKKNERAFFKCPQCGEVHNISAYGMWADEKIKYKCSVCEATFSFYINQIGKVFTEVGNRLEYIGYIYKVL